MKGEISEKTRQEQIAGRKARIAYCLRNEIPLHEVFTNYEGRVELVGFEDDGNTAVVKVRSSLNDEFTTIKESMQDFPSETLITQIMMVAG